ncbi:hypothetical protein Brsp05_04618 [Brucella sp. NBRC 12953]
MGRVPPQLLAMLLQPVIQCHQIWKVWHLLPQAWSGILDVLLDLTLFPAGRWIAELRCKDVMVRYREEAHVDLSLLAAAYTIDRCLHVIVNPTTRHAADHGVVLTPIELEGLTRSERQRNEYATARRLLLT